MAQVIGERAYQPRQRSWVGWAWAQQVEQVVQAAQAAQVEQRNQVQAAQLIKAAQRNHVQQARSATQWPQVVRRGLRNQPRCAAGESVRERYRA